jgi:hypothetical protein
MVGRASPEAGQTAIADRTIREQPLQEGEAAMSRAFGSVRVAGILWVLTLAVVAGPISAQDITGAMQGTVVSPEGKPEPEVRVSVTGPYLQGARETTTDRDGFFQFLALPPGRYALKSTRVGLQPLKMREIVVELGRTTAVGPLTAASQPIELKPVEVLAHPLTLDPVHTTAGGNLSARDYDALPVDRDYKSLIGVLPQVNNSYRGDPLNVAGSTGLENQYYIDGVNVTDTRFGDRATSLPYNFIRAVDVKTGGYEAQYGRALGGIVNAVTYSGTNDFEADVFGFAQPVALSMTPRAASAVAEAGALSYDFGARVSGPVVRDRLWFSAAANPRLDRVEKDVIGRGFFVDRTSAIRYASKLTWRASPAHNVELSVFGDPTRRDQVQPVTGGISTVIDPEAVLARVETGGTVASLRSTWAPNGSFLLQTSVARQWDRWSIGSRSTGPPVLQFVDYVEGTIEGGFSYDIHDTKGRTIAATRGTLTLPRHTVVAGVDFEDAKTTSGQEIRALSRWDSTTWEYDVQTYARSSFHNRSPAAYVQDAWRVTDRFALNGGVRWSEQHLAGASGRTAQRFTGEWQPRAGFSWQLDREGAQRLFGSYGCYYQMLPTNEAIMFFVDWVAVYSFYATDPRLPGAIPYDVIDGSTKESDYAKQIPGLHADSFDEFTLGYERMLGHGSKLTVRGMRRDLRSSFVYGMDPDRDPIWVLGTPGKGDFDFLPPPKREYTALEIAAEGTWRRLGYRTSYVLSRSWGNYPGLYDLDASYGNPGSTSTFFQPHQARNSTGYLPNDRTHVFKLSTTIGSTFGLVAGAFLTLESGAPINEFASGPVNAWNPAFLLPRGQAGRTPALWNLDTRLTWALPLAQGRRAKIQADVLHIGNPRRATQVDEMHYPFLDGSGNPDLLTPNPNYKHPIAYQPPMAGRIGVQVSF